MHEESCSLDIYFKEDMGDEWSLCFLHSMQQKSTSRLWTSWTWRSQLTGGSSRSAQRMKVA